MANKKPSPPSYYKYELGTLQEILKGFTSQPTPPSTPSWVPGISTFSQNQINKWGNNKTTQTINNILVKNGEVPDNMLKLLPNYTKYSHGTNISDGGRIRMLPFITDKLEKMLKEYENDNPGEQLYINSCYRTFDDQLRMARQYGIGRAATPGRSNHGFGRAIDISKNGVALTPQMKEYKWLKKNANKYGFNRIPWGSKGEAWEAWHWEHLGNN
jgi:LAS superfamily LD-carboxypeptidase LdcB